MKQTLSESFKKGSIVLSEQPFVFIVKGHLSKKYCDFCLKSGDLQKCAACNTVYYCNRTCQKSGWIHHKQECPNLKKIAPKVVPDAARMLARIIFKLQRGGSREQGFYTPRQFRVFMDLMSHYQEIKKDKRRMEHFDALSVVLSEYLKDTSLPNPVELLQIYGKMVVNTFNILDPEMQSIGTGMYLGASIVDHSCSPNAVVVFEGTTLNMHTLIDIPSLDWSKTFISYIDLMKLPTERQKDLQEMYYFLCQCSRCVNIEEVGIMTASVCQNNDCRKSLSCGTTDPKAKCLHCGETTSSDTWEEILEISDFTKQQLASMKNVAYLDVCDMCLKKLEGLFDPMNLLKVNVLDMAMDSCIELGHWESALHYGKQLIPPYLRYYGSLHPLTGILFMKMGKLALLKKDIAPAKQWLKNAADILRTTHGDKHSLVRNDLLDLIRQCR